MPFPENKKHVSFSEIKLWKECPHRHKLVYIDKLESYEASPYADFGTAVHDGIENYLKTRTMNFAHVEAFIREKWEGHGYDSPEFLATQAGNSWYKHQPVDEWVDMAMVILKDIPGWLEETFPEWEYVEAEMRLNEQIEGTDMNFKGFVDAIIRTPMKTKGKYTYHVLDWKTTGKGGWGGFRKPDGSWYSKRQDFDYLMQVGFYKKYVSEKLDIPLSSIRTGFVFLKRGAKPGKSLELLKVSAGPKFIERTDKVVTQMITAVNNGIYLKCHDSCKYCPFAESEHCNGLRG